MKRTMGAGYEDFVWEFWFTQYNNSNIPKQWHNADLDNLVFYKENTDMLLGDAKDGLYCSQASSVF